jgi:hypothetical protein
MTIVLSLTLVNTLLSVHLYYLKNFKKIQITMDSVGRPVEGGTTDHQEIQRRFDVEQPDDVNNALQQRREEGEQGYGENLDPNDKVAYIKGEVKSEIILLINFKILKKLFNFIFSNFFHRKLYAAGTARVY